MKVLFVAVLVALAVYVSGEMCQSSQDCVNHGITSCVGSYHVVCHNHHCECLHADSSGACKVVGDCADCSNGRHKHCVDGQCRCARI